MKRLLKHQYTALKNPRNNCSRSRKSIRDRDIWIDEDLCYGMEEYPFEENY